jgi:aldose 1-epimerase
MAYQVHTDRRPAAGCDGTVYILEDSDGGVRAEVWPAPGFNCFRWQVPCQGRRLDLLYSNPRFFEDPVPTRSGIPVLFPFPNRLRAGRFRWDGREYQLPLNDPAKQNAIHGFACRHPWRVVAQGADATAAWLTGEFQGAVDAPECRPLWPADYRLRLTYRLGPDRLRIEALVENPDRVPLPFGLGFHPYFQVPEGAGGREETWVEAPAGELWELVDSLPTGLRRPVDPARDLRRPRRFTDLTLDDVLTGLEPLPRPGGGLYRRGSVERRVDRAVLHLLTSEPFGELVAFTPPHRQAVCLEPYTCVTDAIHLQQQGVDAGLLVLAPGARWEAVVELALKSAPGANLPA